MEKWLTLISILLVITIRQTRIMMTQAKIFLFFQSTQEEIWEDLLENQTKNKKHHLEERELKKEDSPILMLTVCTRSYLNNTAEPWMQSIMITLDVKAGSFTSKAGG